MTSYGNIKSFSYDEAEILNAIIDLHNGGLPFDLDCTYSKGHFYKSGKVPQPLFKSDDNPRYEDVQYARAEALPHADKSLFSIVFDPPFLDGHSPGLKVKSKMQNRFGGSFEHMRDLWAWYNICLGEFYRVLKKGGIVVIKCQDVTSQRAQFFSHCYMLNAANKAGFYAKDLFILLSKTRMRGTWKTQNHARKYHCYFWVFSKQKIKAVNHFINL